MNPEKQSNSILSETELTARLQLAVRVSTAVENRLQQQSDLSNEERKNIIALDKRLFPAGFVPTFRLCEEFRALAKLSQFELQEANEITSHRKILGPFIVLAKRLTWPFLKAHLKRSFDGQQEFNALTVERLAKLSASGAENGRK